MGNIEDKYRHSLALLHKKLNQIIVVSEKEVEDFKPGSYFKGYHRARINCLSDIRDDVMNILNHTKEE